MTNVKFRLESITNSGHNELEKVQSSVKSDFQVSENTQASIDILKQVDNFFAATNKLGQNQTEVTFVHDQEFTNLCHSFATMSAFRQTILQLVESHKKIYGQTFGTLNYDDVESGIKAKVGEFSYNSMLTVFLGCVSPRSFNTAAEIQTAKTETIVARLCSKTAFEVEGWKRIIPVRKIFEKINLNIDDYELSYEKVHHPNSHSIKTVLETLKGKGNSWWPISATTSPFQVRYIPNPQIIFQNFWKLFIQ